MFRSVDFHTGPAIIRWDYKKQIEACVVFFSEPTAFRSQAIDGVVIVYDSTILQASTEIIPKNSGGN